MAMDLQRLKRIDSKTQSLIRGFSRIDCSNGDDNMPDLIIYTILSLSILINLRNRGPHQMMIKLYKH